MYETDDELRDLQALLTRSFDSASAHLQAIMTGPRRLSAPALVAQLGGVCVLNVATVTARGEPRISAVDGHFLHGRWHFTTDASAVKARQLQVRPAISAAYTPRDGFGVFCHGQGRRLDRGSAEFDALWEHWVATYGQSADTLGDDIAYFQIEPSWLVGFAMTDIEMVEIEAAQSARLSAGGTDQSPDQ
jgi:Pyridoxamine 5'-phosphate oxidase